MSQSHHYRFFQNKQCEYFPCHRHADPETFNCLFCYCPLYALGDKCGGNFRFLANGTKDCSACTLPHGPKGYDHVQGHIEDLLALVRRAHAAENGG